MIPVAVALIVYNEVIVPPGVLNLLILIIVDLLEYSLCLFHLQSLITLLPYLVLVRTLVSALTCSSQLSECTCHVFFAGFPDLTATLSGVVRSLVLLAGLVISVVATHFQIDNFCAI